MSNTQVIFKPGGVIALVALCAVVVTVGVVGFRAKNAANAPETSVGANNSVGAAPKTSAEYIADPSMSAGEIADKEIILQLNASQTQAREWLFLGPYRPGKP